MASDWDEIQRLNNFGRTKGSSILNKVLGLPAEEDIAAQKELMDYQQQLAEKAWDYNSPEKQMERLRQAGLNPDLVYGGSGSVQNVVQPSSNNTPQFHSGSTAVPSLINSIAQSALVGSQVEANQAKAEKDRADAGKTGVETSYLRETFGLRFDSLSEHLGLQQDQRKLLQTQVDTFSAYAEQALANVRYLGQLVETERWNTRKTFHETRSAASQGDIMAYRAKMFPQFQDAELQEIISRVNLNKANSSKLFQETKFLISSFDERLRQLQWETYGFMQQGFLSRDLQAYYRSYDDFLQKQTEYYPFQVFSRIFSDPKYVETDKDGNIVFGENGMPKVKHGYQGAKVGLDIAGDIFGIVRDGASAYSSIMMGTAMGGRGFGGFGAAPAVESGGSAVPAAVPKPKSNGSNGAQVKSDEYMRVLRQYEMAPRGSKERARLYHQLMRME